MKKSRQDALAKRPSIRVALVVWGGHPDEVTKVLGIKPDDIRIKGNRISTSPLVKTTYRSSSWELFAKCSEYSYEVEPYISSLFHRISRVKDRIAGLNRRIYSVEVCVHLDILDRGFTPGLVVTETTMKNLLAIRAFLDVDMYIWKKLPDYAREDLMRFKE